MPSSKTSRLRSGSSSKGLDKSTRRRRAASVTLCCICDEPAPGPSAPSSSGREGSTITLDGSKLQRLPRPLQDSHAPNGLLKENELGSSCGILAPQFVHAPFRDHPRSCPPT